MEINYIYCLVDPITYQKRYIGKAKNVEERVRKHMLPHYLKAETYKNRWLRSLKKIGRYPFYGIISEVDSRFDDVNDVERFYIRIFKKAGHPLTNATEGGDGGRTSNVHKWTEEEKKLASLKQKGRIWSKDDPRREQIRQAQIGKAPMQATIEAKIANSKRWLLIDPTGKKYDVNNLSQFCKSLDLASTKLIEVADGKNGRTHHKNWKCTRL